MITKEDCYKVFEGTLTMPEILRMFEYGENVIAEATSCTDSYNAMHFVVIKLAHDKLVELGEVNPDEMFNCANPTSDRSKDRLFDMGRKNGELYTLRREGWVKM